jgi:hypothetical protein
MESMAGLLWNRWQLCYGISGRIHLESVAALPWNTQFCKKQQMQWSKEGAHWLLQTRVRTLNGELGAIFKRWYRDMDIEVEEMPAAA